MSNLDADFIKQNELIAERMSKIKHKIVVMSGKGGVGKTSVAVNLSYALAEKELRVGLLDIDIHGPNVAKMLGIEQDYLQGTDDNIEPVQINPNLKVVSLALFGNSTDEPIAMRGPRKTSIIRQFLSEVNWGELDYLIVDCPPGTGDEPLSALQFINNPSGTIIVTTPQDVAILDARKTVIFSQQLNIPIIGIIENMSGFICPHCNNEINIFKKGGGKKSSTDFNVPFLGYIPFTPQLVELADEGKPFISFSNDNKVKDAFQKIVANIENHLRK